MNRFSVKNTNAVLNVIPILSYRFDLPSFDRHSQLGSDNKIWHQLVSIVYMVHAHSHAFAVLLYPYILWKYNMPFDTNRPAEQLSTHDCIILHQMWLSRECQWWGAAHMMLESLHAPNTNIYIVCPHKHTRCDLYASGGKHASANMPQQPMKSISCRSLYWDGRKGQEIDAWLQTIFATSESGYILCIQSVSVDVCLVKPAKRVRKSEKVTFGFETLSDWKVHMLMRAFEMLPTQLNIT